MGNINWYSMIHEYGIDCVPIEEMDDHYLNAVDPLRRPIHNEDGDMLACICKPLVVFEDGITTVYHRQFSKGL